MFSRHRRKATLLFPLLLCALAPQARATSGDALRGNEVKKAEEVLSRLLHLEEAVRTRDDSGAPAREFYFRLVSKADALPEGNLKTDLLTAALLYVAAAEARRGADSHAPVCEREQREAYRRLCHQTRPADRAQFLRAKARLHTRWAEASLRRLRGARDAATLAALEEVRAERDLDAALAARAVSALKALAALARELTPPEDEAGEMTLPRARSGRLSGGFAEAFDTLDAALASLPRGRLYNLLRNARDSYRDGLYWHGKTLRSRSRVVSVNSLDERDELKASRLDAPDVERAVLANWRSAGRFTKRAEEFVEERGRRAALRRSKT
jgi:hypothetical protein